MKDAPAAVFPQTTQRRRARACVCGLDLLHSFANREVFLELGVLKPRLKRTDKLRMTNGPIRSSRSMDVSGMTTTFIDGTATESVVTSFRRGSRLPITASIGT